MTGSQKNKDDRTDEEEHGGELFRRSAGKTELKNRMRRPITHQTEHCFHSREMMLQ